MRKLDKVYESTVFWFSDIEQQAVKVCSVWKKGNKWSGVLWSLWLPAWRLPLDSATGERIQTEHGTPIQSRRQRQSSERLRGTGVCSAQHRRGKRFAQKNSRNMHRHPLQFLVATNWCIEWDSKRLGKEKLIGKEQLPGSIKWNNSIQRTISGTLLSQRA